MTNSHCIKELKTIDTALKNIVQIVNDGGTTSGLLELVQMKFSEIMPEITLNLSLLDINTLEGDGYVFSNEQKAQIALGTLDIDSVLSSYTKTH